MSKVEKVFNPIYVSEDKTRIDCMVKFDTVPVEIPFTADKNDTEDHGRALYDALVSGAYGEIAAYVPPVAPIIDPAKQVGPKVL